MELNREHLRVIIFYNIRRGLTQQQFIDELNSIFDDEALSRTSVYRWYGEFNRGCSSLQDEFREGCPKSVVVPETIDAVRQLILQNRHVNYRKIETRLGISGTSIHSILHGHLTVKKICSLKKRLVSIGRKKCSKNAIAVLRYTSMTSWHVMNRKFTSMNPKVKSSICMGVSRWAKSNKSCCTRSTSKQMIACFFGKTVYVVIIPLEQRRTVNSEWYSTVCSPVVFQEIRKTKSRKRITLHHDMASYNTSAQTTVFLSTQNIDLMSHPPYSLDLAPNDFFIFPYVKNKMRSQRFSIPEEAVDAFRMHVLEMSQSEW